MVNLTWQGEMPNQTKTNKECISQMGKLTSNTRSQKMVTWWWNRMFTCKFVSGSIFWTGPFVESGSETLMDWFGNSGAGTLRGWEGSRPKLQHTSPVRHIHWILNHVVSWFYTSVYNNRHMSLVFRGNFIKLYPDVDRFTYSLTPSLHISIKKNSIF